MATTTRLKVQAEQLLNKGVAQSTSRVYASAQQIFLEFCHRLNLMPLPVSESTIILFVTELAQTRAHSTIQTYLAGVRHLHVLHGLGNPLQGTLKLELVLRGIHRVQPKKKVACLPVTLGMKETFISHQTLWKGRAKPKDNSELKKRKCENLT